MRGLLAEVAAVARPQGINLDEAERWAAIVALLEKAVGARASMLQDVEAGRRTEIDVVNGAIVEAGRQVFRADAAQRRDGLADQELAEQISRGVTAMALLLDRARPGACGLSARTRGQG